MSFPESMLDMSLSETFSHLAEMSAKDILSSKLNLEFFEFLELRIEMLYVTLKIDNCEDIELAQKMNDNCSVILNKLGRFSNNEIYSQFEKIKRQFDFLKQVEAVADVNSDEENFMTVPTSSYEDIWDQWIKSGFSHDTIAHVFSTKKCLDNYSSKSVYPMILREEKGNFILEKISKDNVFWEKEEEECLNSFTKMKPLLQADEHFHRFSEFFGKLRNPLEKREDIWNEIANYLENKLRKTTDVRNSYIPELKKLIGLCKLMNLNNLEKKAKKSLRKDNSCEGTESDPVYLLIFSSNKMFKSYTFNEKENAFDNVDAMISTNINRELMKLIKKFNGFENQDMHIVITKTNNDIISEVMPFKL